MTLILELPTFIETNSYTKFQIDVKIYWRKVMKAVTETSMDRDPAG